MHRSSQTERHIVLPNHIEDSSLRRWQLAIMEMCTGYTMDPELDVQFEADHDELVISRNIQFSSLCEHHLFPFFGTAAVAYIPQKGKIVGLSKLARCVETYARRLQTQERMTAQIVERIAEALNPLGTAAIIKATHTCQKCRGITKDGEMVTSAMRGVFRTDVSARQELLQLLNL